MWKPCKKHVKKPCKDHFHVGLAFFDPFPSSPNDQMKEGCNQPMMTGFAETTLGELRNKHVDTIAQMDKHGGILLSQPWGWNQTILSYYVANWPKNLLGGNPRMSMNIQVSARLLHQIIPSLATHGTDLTVGHWPPLITPSPCKAHTLRAGRSSCLERTVLWKSTNFPWTQEVEPQDLCHVSLSATLGISNDWFVLNPHEKAGTWTFINSIHFSIQKLH